MYQSFFLLTDQMEVEPTDEELRNAIKARKRAMLIAKERQKRRPRGDQSDIPWSVVITMALLCGVTVMCIAGIEFVKSMKAGDWLPEPPISDPWVDAQLPDDCDYWGNDGSGGYIVCQST